MDFSILGKNAVAQPKNHPVVALGTRMYTYLGNETGAKKERAVARPFFHSLVSTRRRTRKRPCRHLIRLGDVRGDWCGNYHSQSHDSENGLPDDLEHAIPSTSSLRLVVPLHFPFSTTPPRRRACIFMLRPVNGALQQVFREHRCCAPRALPLEHVIF